MKTTFVFFFCSTLLFGLIFHTLNDNTMITSNHSQSGIRSSNKILEGQELVNNGGFEQDFVSWEQVNWPFIGEAQINTTDPFAGVKCAILSAQSSQNRIGYKQKINHSDLTNLSLSFLIKHDNGTLYQAGLAIYYFNFDDSYLGRTYWSVSNENIDENDSMNTIFNIRQNSYPEWSKVAVNINSGGITPPDVTNLSIVKYFEIYLHVYGVSGYGTNISVFYDEISLIESNHAPHDNEINSDDFNNGIGNFWQNPYQLNNSDDWEWSVVSGKVVPVLLPSCDDFSASALSQFETISGPFNISVDLFKLSAFTETSLQLRLFDDNYEPIAKVGVFDRWTNESYQEYAFISTSLEGEWVGWRSELMNGDYSERLQIWRDTSNIIHIALGGVERLSQSSSKQIASIELYIEDSWAFTFDQELILQSNYHWFDNFYSDITEVPSDTFDEYISTSWQVINPIRTDDDWEWVNDDHRAVPKLLSTWDNYSPTVLEQSVTEPINGPFSFSVDIYKYAEGTGTTLSLQVIDEFGYKIAEGGVYDPWASSYYKKSATVFTPDNNPVLYRSNYSIGGVFSERMRIWRDTSDIVHVSLNGQELVSTFNSHGLKMVRLNVYIKHTSSDQELIDQVDTQWFDNFESSFQPIPPISSTTISTTTTTFPRITFGFQWIPSLLLLISSYYIYVRKKES